MKDYRQTGIKKNLWLRARIIQSVRNFFINKGFLEVETPCRIPAPAPEVNIEAVSSGLWFLQTSPELCMKMLLASGYSRIFQICKCFRQNERGNRHLPEMTMLEWYCAGADYFEMMEQTESLIKFVAKSTGFKNSIKFQGQTIDFNKAWEKIPVSQAFEKYSDLSLHDAVLNDKFDEIMAFEIEPKLGINPVFIYDYPEPQKSLAKLKNTNPPVAERFELYIGRIELCNGFTELTDSKEQKERFKQEQQIMEFSGKQTYPLPERFLKALDDMPESSGNALGIDRLVMIFADTVRIDDVTAFVPEEL